MRKLIMEWRSAVRDGVYPLGFAAKVAETTNSVMASWLRPTRGGRLPPAIISNLDEIQGHRLVPFLALVEARFVSHFRKHGLSLQTIRKVARKLRDDYALEHPFAERRFRTDGKRVMMEFAADDGERRLIDIMTDEFGFQSVIEPSLFETIVYLEDKAAKIRPFPEMDKVFIDPRFAMGRPIVEPGRIPTETLASAYLSEGDIAAVAEWFDTDVASVEQAVAFEQRMAA